MEKEHTHTHYATNGGFSWSEGAAFQKPQRHCDTLAQTYTEQKQRVKLCAFERCEDGLGCGYGSLLAFGRIFDSGLREIDLLSLATTLTIHQCQRI